MNKVMSVCRCRMVKFSTLTPKQKPRTKPIKTNTNEMKGAYTLLVIPIGAFCLGTWQISRRKWKLDLLDELQTKASQEAVPLPDNFDDLNDMEYVKVYVRGTFDHDREFLLGPRSNMHTMKQADITLPSERVGFMVITPFVLSDRTETILVNRGWVHKSAKNPKIRPDGQIEGEIDLVGTVRLEEKHNFGKAAMAENNTFMWRDLEKMARYADTAPVFLDADYRSTVDGGPIGGQTPLHLRNQHTSYIITWYMLAAVSGVLWLMKFKRPPLPNLTKLHNQYKDGSRL